MCGIGGLLYFDRTRNVESSVLKKMTAVMRHRGPDDEGYYTDGNAGLCFRRLSIIDLNTGHQPLTGEDSGITIVFNGEIYNFREQREHLQKKGYCFKTATDTEVILHLYEEYREECVQHLRGMFAFAIWDPRSKHLFCARDRFGIKPFYFYADDSKFVFGSEIKVILNAGDIDRSLSYDALDSYFAFGHISGDLSVYKSVRKLLPGYCLSVSMGDKVIVKTQKYWEISFEPDFSRSENYWMQEIENSLSETVKMHMMADVPLGAFLSGGIDSSAVVAMMAKNSLQPVKTFSIGFKNKDFNELPYARVVAEKYHCEHHEEIVEPESISTLPKLVSSFDEPFADTSAIPTYYVSKIAREHVTVVLSGDGGDELFAGYNHYSYLNKIHSFPINFKSPFLSRMLWGGLHKIIPKNVVGKNASYFLSTGKEFPGAYINIYSLEERKKLFLSDFGKINFANGSELYKVGILKKSVAMDFVSNMQYLDLKTYMVDGILTKVDRASMMNSLEVRVPLLDHKFAELTFKIPSVMKFHGTEQKYIFKKAMSAYLPEIILNHPKQGFSIPLSLWFRDDLNEYVNDTLLSANPRIAAFLDKKFIKKVIAENNAGARNSSTRVWSLLFFEEWLNQNRKAAVEV
ncbi:MAG: asparagine synthase (glutamine-hydrolyzing) [Chloroflexota bacterium]